MNVEKYFKAMYANIWQGENLSKFNDYYAKDFSEIISVCDVGKYPLEITMNYDDLLKQAIKQKESCKNVTFEIKKIIEGLDNHISVYFYSTLIDKKTKELRHRYVCGIWHVNKDNKIDRVFAVVAPYYPNG